jgi:hypothetical protein
MEGDSIHLIPALQGNEKTVIYKTLQNSNLISNVLRRFCASELHICIIYATTLPAVLYRCEACSPTLREKRRYRIFEKGVLRKICRPRREELWKMEKNCIIRCFITCTRLVSCSATSYIRYYAVTFKTNFVLHLTQILCRALLTISC